MGVNIEWVAATPSAITGFVRPSEFTDDGSQFFDDDGSLPAGTYGIPIDSGGHITLVYGSMRDLILFAERLSNVVGYIAADTWPRSTDPKEGT